MQNTDQPLSVTPVRLRADYSRNFVVIGFVLITIEGEWLTVSQNFAPAGTTVVKPMVFKDLKSVGDFTAKNGWALNPFKPSIGDRVKFLHTQGAIVTGTVTSYIVNSRDRWKVEITVESVPDNRSDLYRYVGGSIMYEDDSFIGCITHTTLTQ
jgi:hypothetical protein